LHGGHFGARGCGAAVAAPSRRPRLGPARSGRLADIDELTVASLNLHRGFGFFGQPFDVAAALCQLEAETVCVQESWQPDSAEGDSVAEAAGKLGASLRRTTMLRPASLSLPGVSADSGPGDLAIAVLTTPPMMSRGSPRSSRSPWPAVPACAWSTRISLTG
jgi:hypothetical protein